MDRQYWSLADVGGTVGQLRFELQVRAQGLGLCFCAVLGLLACAGRQNPGLVPGVSCSDAARSGPERICAQDREPQTLSVRFRADVLAAGETMLFEGILLVRRPGAVRLKMFGFGGLTVHDSLWVGDAEVLRGRVRRPLSGEEILVEVPGGASLEQPEVVFGRALWSLWQPRCATPPIRENGSWYALDPVSAHLAQRRLRLGPRGVEEERLKPSEVEGQFREIRVAYREPACVDGHRLPGRIEMQAEGMDWRATVRVLDQSVDPDLDERLFSLEDRTGGGS